MKRLPLMLLLITLVALTLPACTSSEEETPVDTELGRMLRYVPYSWLEDQDVWFGNPGKLKDFYGLDYFTSFGEVMNAPEDIRQQMSRILSVSGILMPANSRRPEFFSLVGFDEITVDRALYSDGLPPRGYYILEGDFDETSIGQKLVELDYTETDYGEYSYYGIRGDFEISMTHPLSRLVMGHMNRVAVLEDFIILSPITDDITGIFDTMAGDTPSAIESDACRALVDSLGDVLMATLTTPERIILSDLASEEDRPIMFDFTLPGDWGTLHGYDMAALAIKDEGEKQFVLISLFYTDEEAARTDSDKIVNRMQSYQLITWIERMETMPFTEMYRPNEPVIQQYPAGVVLTITCEMVDEEQQGFSFLLGNTPGMPFRDVLFLAPVPSQYLVE